MNANEYTILEMIVQRLQKGKNCKGLVSLLHSQTMQTLPRALQLNNVDASNQQEIIKACETILKNGEPSK